jgi:hypothetical protein
MLTPSGWGVLYPARRAASTADPDDRGAWGVGREDSDQWPVKAQGGVGGDGKAPKRSQMLVVLILVILRLRTNEGGIEQENEPNSSPAAWGERRVTSGELAPQSS